ncbi:MAG: homoserine dehydrogenase [Candidatus Limnocylindrales bacterium]
MTDTPMPSAPAPEPAVEPDRTGPRVALFGLGTVGTAVAARLLDPAWARGVVARGRAAPKLVGIADLDLETDRGLSIPDDVRQVTDYRELLAAEADVVIELIGGSGVAGQAVLDAFAAGTSVVTANKDLIARRGAELEEAARETGRSLRFEAAVLAGVPVLGPLVGELGANEVQEIRGIFNGTTNYILSTMAADAREYEDVLGEAQARGYAEADPVNDVEGWDAAHKLVILSRLAWGGWIDIDEVRRGAPAMGGEASAGITGVKRSHMGVAARLGLVLKLVSRAERVGDHVRGAVTPMAVKGESRLGATADVINYVEFLGEPVGRVSMAGPGAGGPATSSAILADVLALGAGAGSTWGVLPAAGSLELEDDLGGERGWLVVIEGLGEAGLPASVKELALATTDEGFVTKPVSLTAMSAKLGLFDRPMTAYPVLTDA